VRTAAGVPEDEDIWDRTEDLIARIRGGDRRAENILLGRYLEVLKRWAHGRLPAYARGLAETQDLVQIALVKAFLHLKRFQPRHQGSFHMFLRTIVTNEIRGLIRKVKRRPMMEALSDRVESREATPLEIAIGRELYEQYEKALPRLSPEQAEAIVLFEMGFSYGEIARILGLEHANAARMRVSRAILRLSKLLGRSRE